MSLPYFPMYPSNFEAKTSHLTLAEDGAYNRLLRMCWMTPGCSIPADEAWIMRRLRAVSDADKEAVRSVLAEFFTIKNGRYSNARLSEEWVAANEAYEKRKNAGSKGGKAKALKSKETGPSNAKAMPKQPELEPEVREDTDVSSKGDLVAKQDGFEAFWFICPNKVAKQAARKAWAKLSMPDRRAAYAAVRDGWFEGWQSRHPQASPLHPATFLNNRRWEDQPANVLPFNGGPNDTSRRFSANSDPDATARRIAFAAAAGRSPSSDCF